MLNKLPMTTEGFTALETELKYCREVERPRIIQQLADARTPEDLSEQMKKEAIPAPFSQEAVAGAFSQLFANLLSDPARLARAQSDL